MWLDETKSTVLLRYPALVVSALADATMVVIELHELSRRIYVRWLGNDVFYISWYTTIWLRKHHLPLNIGN